MTCRVLLLRPPRYVWPFNSETSAFWQPLGLLCLAGAVRRELPDVRVEVLDAPGLKIGWRTLRERLVAQRIDVLGIGEETVSAHEGLRAAAMAKELWPQCVIVAGGMYYPYAIDQTLDTGLVDVIVRGEGEVAFVELLRTIADRSKWTSIDGIAFRDGAGKTILTPPRPLVEDMDSLPGPAYDLLDMSAYGRGSRNHPALVSIEHSRGCTDSCSFCILWKHMGRCGAGVSPADCDTGILPAGPIKDKAAQAGGLHHNEVLPAWRTKSPARSLDEVLRLYRDFDRRTFGWVDPTFNASTDWSDAWSELMLRSDLVDAGGRARTLHTAWVRADGIIRDHRAGVLEKLVRAGLRQVMIGVERADTESMAMLGKHSNGPEVTAEAFAILREHYPQVYTIGTMIFGLPGDGPRQIEQIVDWQYRLGMDYCFLIPLTPNPGTAVAEQAARGGYLANGQLERYNFQTPVCRTDQLGLRELESTYWRMLLRPSRRRLALVARQIFLERDRRKRRVHASLLKHGARIAARSFVRAITGQGRKGPSLFSRKPSWYDL